MLPPSLPLSGECPAQEMTCFGMQIRVSFELLPGLCEALSAHGPETGASLLTQTNPSRQAGTGQRRIKGT